MSTKLPAWLGGYTIELWSLAGARRSRTDLRATSTPTGSGWWLVLGDRIVLVYVCNTRTGALVNFFASLKAHKMENININRMNYSCNKI